jgi:hypothetical protein
VLGAVAVLAGEQSKSLDDRILRALSRNLEEHGDLEPVDSGFDAAGASTPQPQRV